MNLYETVQACKQSEDNKDPSCSKQALSDAFIQEINESKSKSALAELKPGETLNLQTVSSLNDKEEKFFENYQQQLVWGKPMKHDLDTLNESLGKMSTEDGLKYIHQKVKENRSLKSPASNYENYGTISERAPNVDLLSLRPEDLASANRLLAGNYADAMRKGAVEFYDGHHKYEAVRALSFELGPNYWSKDPGADLRQRPEIDISSAQQKVFLDHFDRFDLNGNGEVSKSEIKKELADPNMSKADHDLLVLLDKHRDQLAHANDDSIFLPETGISKEDMKHIGRQVPDQPKKFFQDLDEALGDPGNVNPYMLSVLR